jgi:SH3 domain-containing protein
MPESHGRFTGPARLATHDHSTKHGSPLAALYWLVVSLRFRIPAYLLIALLAVSFSGCKRGRGKVLETAYVSAPQVVLRDHVAAVFAKTGTVKNGDRVEVLERERRFVRVRIASGSEGWMEQRYLASQQVYDGFQKLAQDSLTTPVQGTGTTRNDTNLHVEPGRDTDHLYLLLQGSKVSFLKRTSVEKTLPGEAPKPAAASTTSEPAKPVPMEDWWLVRDAQGHAGWVLARMIDLDVPLEIAEYAEGQRIVAFFVLDEVTDADKKVPQYLMLLNDPKDGMPYDYNQIRVFTWNVRRHRYETAYRERNLNGVLPVTVSQENFDKEGMLPVFVVRVKDDSGNLREMKYKMNTPIVRRVLAPGEEPVKPVARKKRRK